jgi:antitoxin component of MazEF toxin-antitoxin module
MSRNDTTMAVASSTVTPNNVSDSGSLYVPAQVQRDLGICIGTTVEVVIRDFDHDFIESVEFENDQVAGDSVTVPAHIMRTIGLHDSTEVTAEFRLPDEVDETESELGEAPGALEDEEDKTLDDILDETFGTDDEEAEEEDEQEEEGGLGELFG